MGRGVPDKSNVGSTEGSRVVCGGKNTDSVASREHLVKYRVMHMYPMVFCPATMISGKQSKHANNKSTVLNLLRALL